MQPHRLPPKKDQKANNQLFFTTIALAKCLRHDWTERFFLATEFGLTRAFSKSVFTLCHSEGACPRRSRETPNIRSRGWLLRCIQVKFGNSRPTFGIQALDRDQLDARSEQGRSRQNKTATSAFAQKQIEDTHC